ncbi:MAG: cell division protein FtsA [Patescibacteria group bacterium]
MNRTKIISGIELGSSKVTTLIAQVVKEENLMEQSVNVMGVATSPSKGIKKGQIVNIDEAVEATISSVEAAERMAGYNLNSAFISLGGANIHSQNSHGVVAVSDQNGEITEDDVDRVIDAARAISIPQSREVIHVIPREFIVDGESGVKDPTGMSGVRLEVETHIITASDAAMKNLRKAVKEVGIEVSEFVFTGLASSESVLTSTEKELGCVLVDIGGGTTSLSVFVEGAPIYSSVIPIGAKNVTNDLAIGLRVSLEDAEKIKLLLSDEKKIKKEDEDELDLVELGLSDIKKISKKTLVEGIIKPRLNEIFSIVKLELDREGLGNRVPSGVIITGGGAQTIGVLESAKRVTLLSARIGKPQGLTGLIDDILDPSYATVSGLALYGARFGLTEPLTSFTKRIKLPTKGVLGKFFGIIKDLLP